MGITILFASLLTFAIGVIVGKESMRLDDITFAEAWVALDEEQLKKLVSGEEVFLNKQIHLTLKKGDG